MHINQLSDLSFRFIFRNIPNRHLQTASFVCPKWSHFGTDKARHRQVLLLFFGREEDWDVYQSIKMNSSYTLCQCPQMKSHLTEGDLLGVLTFFPNITKLTAYITRPIYLHHLSQLLFKRKSSLVRLAIRAFYPVNQPIEQQTGELAAMRVHFLSILHSINSLTSLVDLGFYTNVRLLAPHENSLDLPIFTRLETLSWNTPDGADCLVNWLLKYNHTSSPLKELAIGSLFKDYTRLNEFQNEFFMTRLKNLQFTLNPGLGHLTELPSFTLLTGLNIVSYHYPLGRSELSQYLGPLTQLNSLYLSIQTDTLEAWSQEEEEEMFGRLIAPSSVEWLYFTMPTPFRSHSLFGRLQLHRFFPKLRALFLRNTFKPDTEWRICTECTENSCDYNWIYGVSDGARNTENVQFCKNQIVKSLSEYKDLFVICN